MVTDLPELPEPIRPLAFLLGTWRGEGVGLWPADPEFRYGEEVTVTPTTRSALRYEQRTWHPADGRPLHFEVGYLRCAPGPEAELLVVQPTGVVEVHAGPVEGTALRLRPVHLGRSPAALPVTAVERQVAVEGEQLVYLVRIGMNGERPADHLRARLRRVAG